MTQDEIIAAVRKAIREPVEVTVPEATITSLIGRGINLLWLIRQEIKPYVYLERTSLTSNHHVFALPSDCEEVVAVWDMGESAVSITGATNASPIVITAASHGFSTGDIVFIHGVLGNTAANGTWAITKVDDDSFSLNGSQGDDDYDSGGRVFKESASFCLLRKIDHSESTLNDKGSYFLRETNIVVDSLGFENDLVLDYMSAYTPGLTDIPAEFHEGLVSYCVMQLIPSNKANNAQRRALQFHVGMWNKFQAAYERSLIRLNVQSRIPQSARKPMLF